MFKLVLLHGADPEERRSLAEALRTQAHMATVSLVDPVRFIAGSLWGCSADVLWGSPVQQQAAVPGNIPWVWCLGRARVDGSLASCRRMGHASGYGLLDDTCSVCDGILARGPLTVEMLLQHLETEFVQGLDADVWARAMQRRIGEICGRYGTRSRARALIFPTTWGTCWPPRGPARGVVVTDVRRAGDLSLLRSTPGCDAVGVKLKPAHPDDWRGAGELSDAHFEVVEQVPLLADIGARVAYFDDLARRIVAAGEVTESCRDCPIGNRDPNSEDYDPSRGPCPRAESCDAECMDQIYE